MGTARGKLNGWTQRMIDHPLLRGKPAADRLGAFFVTARCDREDAPRSSSARWPLCRLTSRDLALEVMETLARAQWLAHVTSGPKSGHAVNVTLAHPIRHLAPGSPPRHTTPLHPHSQGRGPTRSNFAAASSRSPPGSMATSLDTAMAHACTN